MVFVDPSERRTVELEGVKFTLRPITAREMMAVLRACPDRERDGAEMAIRAFRLGVVAVEGAPFALETEKEPGSPYPVLTLATVDRFALSAIAPIGSAILNGGGLDEDDRKN